ncbi:MAG: phospholipase D-like domain-containing protein, partial [Phormidium sp.]
MLHLPTCKLPKVCPAIVLAFFFSACQKAVPQTQNLTPLPQDPFVQVYFNHAQLSEYIEPYRPQKRSGDNLEKVLVDTINTAQSTVDIAVQELRLPNIAQALVQRQKAGVKVRVILENNYSRPWSKFTVDEIAKLPPREQERYKEYRKLVDQNEDEKLEIAEINQRDALVILQNARIPIIDDTADGSAGSGLMHHKFVIVDRQKLIITSANFTTSDIHGDLQNLDSLGNDNSLLKINSPELATVFTEEFNLMWGDGVGGKPDSKFGVKKPFRPVQTVDLGTVNISVQFSPTSKKIPWEQSSNGLIGKTLVAATESIDLALFVFSEQQIADTLETNHQRGVKIKALIEPDFAYRYYSEALDMMGVALVNDCKYEINNRPWQNPINNVGTPLLRKGDLLHHKFAVIDGKIAIAGSH